jgi:hypothetical protein
VVELAGHVQHLDLTQAALAAQAVPHHLHAVVAQGVEHRPVVGHRDLAVALLVQPDHERLRREATARGERLELQPVGPALLLAPGPLGGVPQPQRAAQVELAVGVEALDLGADVESLPLSRDEQLEPVAEQLLQLLDEGHLLTGASGVQQPERPAVAIERPRHAEDRRDADPAGDQQVLGPAVLELEVALGLGHLHTRPRIERAHEHGPAAALGDLLDGDPVRPVHGRLADERVRAYVGKPADLDGDVQVAAGRVPVRLAVGLDLDHAHVDGHVAHRPDRRRREVALSRHPPRLPPARSGLPRAAAGGSARW